MRRTILALLVALGAWALTAAPPLKADPPTSCILVLCQPCPEGFRLLFQPNNCCRCVPDN